MCRPRAGSGVVPEYISAQLVPRQAQFFLGELLSALSAVHSCWSAIHGRRLAHFLDNQGALACLLSGSAKDDDAAAIACLCQLATTTAETRCRLEYVEIPANISDGPSRDGRLWGMSEEAVALGGRGSPSYARQFAQQPAV